MKIYFRILISNQSFEAYESSDAIAHAYFSA
jgi:hypothetical protein